MVIFRVGGINLVIVGRSGRQTGKCHLVARDHGRINWRSISVGNGSSVIDRGIGGNNCCPKELSTRNPDLSPFYVFGGFPYPKGPSISFVPHIPAPARHLAH